MAAQVHAAPSALHTSFPGSAFSSAATSPAATPSSEREIFFDNLAGLTASSRFEVKPRASPMSATPSSQAASSSLPTPGTSSSSGAPMSPTSTPQTLDTEPANPPALQSSRRQEKAKETSGQPAKPERTSDEPAPQAPAHGGTRSQRPRLQSLQTLNKGPASPSLSGSISGNAQLLTSSATFSRPGASFGGGAIERLQPLAAANATSGAQSSRSESSTSVARGMRSSAAMAETPNRASGSTSPWPAAASRGQDLRNENEYTEFGAFPSASATRSSLEAERSVAARARTQSAHLLSGPGLKRSNTMSAGGFESLSSVEAGGGTRSGNSSTFGFASAAGGRARHGPGLGARRQTVSNIHANDFDHMLSSQGRTMAYTQQAQHQHQHIGGGPSSGLLTSPQSQSHVRDRVVLQGNQLEAKVVILGTQGVGKTSLVHRYTSGQFSASSIPSTIGASFLTKKLIVDGVKVRLQLWDTAGQERFRSMAPMYYRGSNAAVIVYDITSMQSFMDVKSWIEELRRNMASDLVIHIVGAKLDLAYSRRAVTLDFARSTIRSWIRPAVTPPASPDLSQSLSPTKSTSRLGGLGTLAIGSASRLANFPRQSPPSGQGAKAGSAGSSAGSAGSEPCNDSFSDQGGLFGAGGASGLSSFPSWEQIEVSEVSAKDDEGIEDVFLAVTKKLVERKAVIEQERIARERNSIILSESSWDQSGAGPGDRGAGGPGEASWGCCT